QGQAGASLSIGLARESPAHQMRHVIAGGVAVQDLHHKGMNRDHGSERALAPDIAEILTKPLDHGRLQMRRDIRLDSAQCCEDTVDHPWPPGKSGAVRHTIFQEAPFSSKPSR